jgi:hypothetical protein
MDQVKSAKGQGTDDIDFEAMERALSGLGPMPPGLPGRKK